MVCENFSNEINVQVHVYVLWLNVLDIKIEASVLNCVGLIKNLYILLFYIQKELYYWGI